MIFALLAPAFAPGQQSPQIVRRFGAWTIDPFVPGYALLDGKSPIVYGYDYPGEGLAQFPQLPVRGNIVIPVFMVDWSDFNPKTDESNHNNPYSVFPGYVRSTPAALEQYLNASNGPAGYFREVSGGQFQVQFRVFGWIVSNQSAYLQNKEPTYYYRLGDWYADTEALAKDVLRAAVVDLGVDLTQFDADGNHVLDGFVIVYEGFAGKLAGTNMSYTNPAWNYGPPAFPSMDNVASLVATNDPYYSRFQGQNILFNRYCNIPEQYTPNGPQVPGQFTTVETWAHELGHLLLGYRDYYYDPADLGSYAMSARSGNPNPFHPAALEKWLFGKWVDAPIVSNINVYPLADHHLKAGQLYTTNVPYLYRVRIDGDPLHYLTFENRYFLPPSQGGSQFNEEYPGSTLESGVIIFEVNQHLTTSDQIRRLLPPGDETNIFSGKIGAWQPGDVLEYELNGFHLTVKDFTAPGPMVTFSLSYKVQITIGLQNGHPRLTFRPVPGLDHIVQYADRVFGGSWTSLPNPPHNTGVVIDQQAVLPASRFYRVLLRNR